MQNSKDLANQQANHIINTCGIVADADRLALVLTLITYTREFQLDAFKAGMTEAISLASKKHTREGAQDLIRQTRDKLTIDYLNTLKT